MNIRPIEQDEYGLLEEFLYLAVFVPPGCKPPPREVVYEPGIHAYIDGFGRPDDVCLVAEEDGTIVAAAWSRVLAGPGREGYGSIDARTPELAIAVMPKYRRRGIGTRLIKALADTLRAQGYERLSLSVQKENPAVRLYRRLGFAVVRENGEDYVMALGLGAQTVIKGENTKSLSEMTRAELWQLFPIQLSEHNPAWTVWYHDEQRRLVSFLGKDIARIDHIGSTAVKGLLAKPIVDILLQLNQDADLEKTKSALIADGWLMMAEGSSFGELDLNKGYTPQGFAKRVYHLHVRYVGDWDEICFRDYLAKHPERAAEYAALKRRLLDAHENDRDAHTAAKTDFIRICVKDARAEAGMENT